MSVKKFCKKYHLSENEFLAEENTIFSEQRLLSKIKAARLLFPPLKQNQ